MKQVQVIWTDEALNDLETIYDFLAEQSQSAAQRIVESILTRSRQLEAFPESGAKQEIKTSVREYRFIVEDHYKVIYTYQLETRTVYIATIFDTRLDPEKLKV